MSKTYEINVVPASRREIETLRDVEREFDAVRGDDQAAVFGQLWVDGTAVRLKAHVFSGEAMKYLNDCILNAIHMQKEEAALRGRDSNA